MGDEDCGMETRLLGVEVEENILVIQDLFAKQKLLTFKKADEFSFANGTSPHDDREVPVVLEEDEVTVAKGNHTVRRVEAGEKHVTRSLMAKKYGLQMLIGLQGLMGLWFFGIELIDNIDSFFIDTQVMCKAVERSEVILAKVRA